MSKAFTIPQFIATYKAGRTRVFEEIASGRLVTYKVGRRRYISAHAAEDWQRRLEKETAINADTPYLGRPFSHVMP